MPQMRFCKMAAPQIASYQIASYQISPQMVSPLLALASVGIRAWLQPCRPRFLFSWALAPSRFWVKDCVRKMPCRAG